jgi:hypothetical protein
MAGDRKFYKTAENFTGHYCEKEEKLQCEELCALKIETGHVP